MLCVRLVGGVVRGELDGVTGLAALAVAPAVGLAEGAAAVGSAVGAGVGWLRRQLAAGLRAVAERLDPVPVAAPVEAPLVVLVEVAAPVEAQAVVEAPLILTMPAAAQVTCPDYPRGVDYAATVEACGSVRAAARHLGIAESTLRSRAKRAGVKLPTRKAKR